MLRVIAGEAKGRKLVAPEVPGLRPTSDRVRESMFDVLEARGLIEDAEVLDLFSGSGALGIEALSRGAAGVTFVESDGRAVRAIEKNLEVTGYLGLPHVRVVRADVLSWVSTYRQGGDLALADPPYRFEGWGVLLGQLKVAAVLAEHRFALMDIGSYAVSREYRYGGTLVTLLLATPGATRDEHSPLPPDPPDPDKDPA
jgi:16S rRNA (guanine966-N2)-methyltransferase